MEIRDLRYFCTVAEMEHITKASASLNITQPYLTKVIHRLEEDVGGELFEPAGRRIKLTYAGEVFYKYARRVLAAVDNLYSEMDYIFDRHAQTVSVLVNTDSLSTRLIQEFNRTDPDYALSVQFATLQEMEEALLNGSAQFAISSPPIKSCESDIDTRQIMSVSGCILLPPGHRYTGRDKVTIDEIREERIVTMPKGAAMRNRLQPALDDYSYHPKIVLETNNLSIIAKAVQNNLGIAFITELMAIDFGTPRDSIVGIDIPDVVAHFGLSWNRLTVENRSCKHFLNFVQGFFADLEAVIERESPLRVPETEQSV